MKGAHLRHGMADGPEFLNKGADWRDGYAVGYAAGGYSGFRFCENAALGALAIGLGFWMAWKKGRGFDVAKHYGDLELFVLWELAAGSG